MSTTKIWVESLNHLWKLERGARLHEHRVGGRLSGFNKSGVHEVSMLWGKVWACEELCPHLQQFGSYPTELKSAARSVANGEFRNEVVLAAICEGDVVATDDERETV